MGCIILNMKKTITILLLIITTNYGYSQIDTLKLDTLPAYVKVNRCLQWNYYHEDGTLLWANAEYNTALVPLNGYMAQSINMTPNNEIIKGYCSVRYYSNGKIKEIIAWLDANKKEIKNRWVEPHFVQR